MSKRRVLIAAFVITTIIGCLVVGSILLVRTSHNTIITEPTKNATFVLSSWNYPDNWTQGISEIWMDENSTGSWVPCDPAVIESTDSSVFETPAIGSTSLRLQPRAEINHDILGLDNVNEAKAIMRLNITVWYLEEVIFSEQNLTANGESGSSTASTWWIEYEVVLEFLIVAYHSYIVELTYEIYYPLPSENEYLHDCQIEIDMDYYDNSNLEHPSEYGIDSNGAFVEIWIIPDGIFQFEQVVYKLDFDNIDNTESNLEISIRYKVEGANNRFSYRIVYDDETKKDSASGDSTSWAILNITPDAGKTLDYILLYNHDYPDSVSTGNLSIWMDYIRIDHVYALAWNEITEVPLYLSMAYDYWALNMSLIFGGLILMLVSACIVAVKVRDRTISQDAGMLLLFLFCVGWGLFIGGTLIG